MDEFRAPSSEWHRLSDVDEQLRTAVCSVCGPTKIRVRPNGHRCWARVLEERKKRPKPPASVTRRYIWGSRLRGKYGLEPHDWHAMLVSQSGRCLICTKPMREPYVDHDHTTGAVRGLLCPSCNTAIGLLEENAASIVRALRYLGHDPAV